MSGTQQPGGRGSHTGGNNDMPEIVVNAAGGAPVTNQHILSLPNSVHHHLSLAAVRALSIIEIEFALQVSQATTHAYARILEELRRSPAPPFPPNLAK